MLETLVVFAADFGAVTNPIVELINALMVPALAIVGALGAIFCIILGVKFAKAEEQQEREKAKASLKNAIIGFVLIFVLLVALNIGMGIMTDWAEEQAGIELSAAPAITQVA
ncbi:MAG: pilin [Defluviitaleaceae bacterium]|nr:pilin [Defluviitaleaceae bacterium]